MRKMPTKLNAADREALAALTFHPGFKVLQALMEARCKHALAEILEVSPTDPKRGENISLLQLRAFTANEFCNDLLADMNFQLAEMEPDEQ